MLTEGFFPPAFLKRKLVLGTGGVDKAGFQLSKAPNLPEVERGEEAIDQKKDEGDCKGSI